MEFMTRTTINLPQATAPALRDGLMTDEFAAGAAMIRSGKLERIWRLPGQRANMAVWNVTDATELHDLLSSLPLFPYMRIEVFALSTHPLEHSGD